MIQARREFELRYAETVLQGRRPWLPGPASCSLITAVALAACFLCGCAAGKPSKYYQLTIPSAAVPTEKPGAVPITLVLGSMITSHLYSEDRIVYGNGGEELGAYQYQRWAEPPSEMIQDILLRDLRNTGLYRAVYFRRSNIQGDFALRGRLYDFNEVDGSPMTARVTFELEMRNLKTGATVWTHYFTHDEPVAKKDINAVVTALDHGVKLGVSEMVASLNQYFAANPVK